MNPDIIAIGEPLMEFSALNEGPLGSNSLFRRGYGGDTSNFAVAAARAGARVGYVTAVGKDPFGRSLIDLWEKEGIDVSSVQKSDQYSTGVYFISRHGGGHEFTYFRTNSAASRMTPDILPEDVLARTRILHFSGISQGISRSACDTCLRALDIAKKVGTLVSYDPNLRTRLWDLDRARTVIHGIVPQVDILFPSFEDACELTGLNSPDDIITYYRDLGAGIIVLKCGDQGALLSHDKTIQHFGPLPVEPVDASGAGDVFCGAFMAEYVRGSSLEDCMRFAGGAAALSVRGLGCVSSIPKREEILKALAENRDKNFNPE